jgi:hypothetical protein
MFFSPRKWITISPLNLLWLTDPHDLQGIPTPDWQTGLIPPRTHLLQGEFLYSEDRSHNRINTLGNRRCYKRK